MKDHETQMETLKLLADSLRNGLTLIEELTQAADAEPVQEVIPFAELEEASETKLPKRLTPLKDEYFAASTFRKNRKVPTPADVATAAAAHDYEADENGMVIVSMAELYANVRKSLTAMGMNVPDRKGIRYSLHLHGVPIMKKRYCGSTTNVANLTDLLF